MWILSCDGDSFQHKKIWLKPGKSYLFGRTKVPTKENETSFHISNKSVSRKHLVIAVTAVPDGDGLQLHTRSKITITDDSKLGTVLDDEKVVKATRILTKPHHTIQLGSYDQSFRIEWHPVVLTQQTHSAQILESLRLRVEKYDIKTITDYMAAETTHLISLKRNIPKGLQALLCGKYIATDAFVDAIVLAAEPVANGEAEGATSNSPLEDDYDGNWPEAMHFLPGSGQEPKPRAPELFAPDVRRQNMFEGYTFVLADAQQHDTLFGMLTSGGGKAVLFDMHAGHTELREFVEFVKNVAGEKGVGELEDGGEGKGVVVIRWRARDEAFKDWTLTFMRNVDLELGIRSVDQNEFLDAILTSNASALRQPLLEEEENASGLPTSSMRPRLPPSSLVQPKPPHTSSMPQPDFPSSLPTGPSAESQAPEDVPKSALRHRLRRTIAQPRFKGFDDFDASQLPTRTQIEEPESSMEVDSYPKTQQEFGPDSQNNGDSQSLFLREESQPATQATATRKRRHPPSDEEEVPVDADAMIDTLLPAAAAMKKRRLEEERAGISQPLTKAQDTVHSTTTSSVKPAAKKKALAEVDVRAAAKSNAASMDARARHRREEEETQEGALLLNEDDIAGLRDLAIIEEMEIVPRSEQRGGDDDDNAERPRWDERWNGRQNFKRFRKRRPNGEGGGADAAVVPNRARKVIVPLEEAARKDYGIGEAYWLEGSDARQKEKEKRRKQRSSQSQTQTQTQGQSQRALAIMLDDDGDEELLPEEIAGVARDAGLASAVADAEEATSGRASTTAKGKGKRPATGAAATKAPPAKRQTTMKATKSRYADDDSEEEAMQFKFRRER